MVTGGCFSGWGKPADPFRPEESAGGEVRITVENLNFNDVTIFAVRGGQRLRLGDVTGKSLNRFTMRLSFSLDVSFEAFLVGNRGCTVRALPVDPGDEVWVRIPVSMAAGRCESGKG